MALLITVTDATGKTGKELLRVLSHSGIRTRAATRNLQGAIPLPNVDWVEGDLGDQGFCKDLVAGSDGIYVCTGFSPLMATMEENAILRASAFMQNWLAEFPPDHRPGTQDLRGDGRRENGLYRRPGHCRRSIPFVDRPFRGAAPSDV